MAKQTDYILKYYQQIVDGRITVGKWVRLAYDMVVDGLETKKFTHDLKKSNHAINWIEHHCFHTEGKLAPNEFKLELWEKAFISVMFGIVNEDGDPYFNELFLLVARKNGKSLLGSAICRYKWINGGFGARVYNIAPKLDQADIVYGNVWTMTTLDPEWQEKERLRKERDVHKRKLNEDDPTQERHRMTDLYLPATTSTMKKIAFSAKKSDGFNPSLFLLDEVSSWEGDKGLKQYEVITSAFGARPDAQALSITTSGYINDSVFDELMKRSTSLLLGNSKVTNLFPCLYMIDDEDKWNDIEELKKSNPNLGVSIRVKFLLNEIAKAEESLSKLAEFKTKYCCIKQNSSQALLDTKTVDKCTGAPLDLNDFRGCYCVAGIDLSRTTDLTACCVVIEKDGELFVFSKFFLPSEKIEEATARDGLPYRAYIQRGFLVPSGENFVDYNDCFDWYKELLKEYEIMPLKVGYDRYNSQYLTQDMQNYGFHMDDVYQGENLSGVIDELVGLMKDGKINIGDNDLLKIHLLDSAVKQNSETQRKRLIKVSANVHIDGMASLLDAMTVRQKWYSEIGGQLKNERS